MSGPDKIVVGEECRFAIHMPARNGSPDIHLIKKRTHYSDGTTEPTVEFRKDFKRGFGVTKREWRNHEQKKESESFDRLIIQKATQSNLARAIARALGRDYGSPQLRDLSASPYLYGSDISSTSLIKLEYKKKFPDLNTRYTVAFGDTETDVLHGTNEPIIGSLTYENEMQLSVTSAFLEGERDVEARYMAMMREYLGDVIDEYGLNLSLKIVDGPIGVIKNLIDPLHQWKPDFFTFWNMDFDIGVILETCKNYGVDPADILCDPAIPFELRTCKYKKGSTKKVTASGAVKPKNPSEQWHTLVVPSSFYWIDQMCSYRFIRQGEQEEQSYGLHDILTKVIKRGKLKVANTENGEGLDWHIEMQRKYKIEYMVYAAFDTIGMMLLEKKTKDLSLKLPLQSEISDFSSFSAQSKRFADNYFVYLLGEKELIATIPPRPKDSPPEDIDLEAEPDDDDDGEEGIKYDEDGNPITVKDSVMGMADWIITLKPHLIVPGNKGVILEDKNLRTYFRLFTYDSDAVSAYPSCASSCNVSKRTTLSEIIEIIGIDEMVFRGQNINLLQGHVNALEYCEKMFSLPPPQVALKLFEDMPL